MAAETSSARTAFDSVYERQLARTVRLAYLLVRSRRWPVTSTST